MHSRNHNDSHQMIPILSLAKEEMDMVQGPDQSQVLQGGLGTQSPHQDIDAIQMHTLHEWMNEVDLGASFEPLEQHRLFNEQW